tara:strand:+ start:1303 stop:1527 length:225 start_codon:yes stop_codon:yes gene_type:complete
VRPGVKTSRVRPADKKTNTVVSGLEIALILFTVNTQCILFLDYPCDESTRIARRLPRDPDHNIGLAIIEIGNRQ